MYKRFISTLLAVQMLLSMGLSAGAVTGTPPLEEPADVPQLSSSVNAADDPNPTDNPDTSTGTTKTIFAESDPIPFDDENDIDNDTLYQQYILEQMGLVERPQVLADYYKQVLTAEQQVTYEALKAEIEKVAAGTRTDATSLVTFDTSDWTEATWECSSNDNTQPLAVLDETKNEFVMTDYGRDMCGQALQKAGVFLMMDCLSVDCPYELYWFDKTQGFSYSYGYDPISYFDEEKKQIKSLKITGELTFHFNVSKDYAGTTIDENKVGYVTDAKKTGAAAAVKDTIQTIIDKYAAKTDYEKLIGYKDEICQLVDYNHAAAADKNTPYGDPWQLIHVFDKDSKTEVVCEGYSKAFQYLCDHTTFTDKTIVCYTVTGFMSTNDPESVAGAGAHMWNIVKIGDNNYLADVTNSDDDTTTKPNDPDIRPTIGSNGDLFLAGSANELSIAGGGLGGYDMPIDGSEELVRYTYDNDTFGLYDEKILRLANKDYTPETTVKLTCDTLPTASTTYGNTLKSAPLTGGKVVDNTDPTKPIEIQGTWAWADETLPVNGVNEKNEFKANFTISDPSQYEVTYEPPTNVPVTVTVQAKPFDDTTEPLVKFDDIPDQTYTGQAITPAITAHFGKDYTLTDKDYTVAYTNNTAVGTATATVTGRGNFTGTKALPFTIKQGKPTVDPTTLAPEKPVITYGETLKVNVPTITAATLAATDPLPAKDQVGLYTEDGKQLTTATVATSGSTTLTYETKTDKTSEGRKLKLGENKLIVKYGGSDNFETSEKLGTVTVTINPKPLTATLAAGQSKDYDGTAEFSGLNAALTLNSETVDDVTCTLTGATVGSANAGEYTTVTDPIIGDLTGTDAAWYEKPKTLLLGDGVKFTINPLALTQADVSFDGSDTKKIPGRLAQITLTIKVPSGAEAGFPTASQIVLTAQPEDAPTSTTIATVQAGQTPGTYTATYQLPTDLAINKKVTFSATLKDAKNYTLTTAVTHELTVSNKYSTTTKLDVSPKEDEDVTYGDKVTLTATIEPEPGSDGTPAGTVTFKDGETEIATEVPVENGKATYTDPTPVAGPHSYTAIFNPTPECGFNGQFSAPKAVTVDPKPLTIEGLTAPDHVYDGKTTVELTGGKLTGVLEKDEGKVTVTIPTTGEAKEKNVGEQAVTVDTPTLDGDAKANYDLQKIDVTKLKVNITKRPLEVATATLNPKAFDNTTTAEVDSITFKPAEKDDKGLIDGDTLTMGEGKDFTATAEFENADVGEKNKTATITITPGNTPAVNNYQLPTTHTLTGQTIAKGTAPTVTHIVTMVKNQPDYKQEIDLIEDLKDQIVLTANDTFTSPVEPAGGYKGLTSATIERGSHILTLVSDNKTVEEGVTDKVTVTVSNMHNYNDTATITITVNYTDKKPLTISGITVADRAYNKQPIVPDTTKLKYTGSDNQPVTSGVPTDNDLVYTYWVKDGDKLPGAPTNAGTYQLTVSIPDNNENYTGSVTIDFTISKVKLTIKAKDKRINPGSDLPTLTSEEDYEVTGLIKDDELTTKPTLTYDPETPDTSKAGTTAIIKISGAVAGPNYELLPTDFVNGTLTIGSLPTGSLSFNSKEWEDVAPGTDATVYYTNPLMRVLLTLKSVDGDETQAKIQYTTSSQSITDLTASTIKWTDYTAPFTLTGNTNYVYAKLTDEYQSTKYLGSAKLVLDQTPPVIKGVVDGTTYHDAPKITVEETNLKEVTVNGTAVTLADDKTYQLVGNAKGDEQTIVATDLAGNTTTVKVKAYNGHQYETETIQSECEGGSVTIKTCTICGDQEITDSGKHEWGPEQMEAATCTEKGRKFRKCSKCNVIKVSEVLEATGHTVTDSKFYNSPNSTTHWQACANGCGMRVNEVPHIESEWLTDNDKGILYTKCTECDLPMAQKAGTDLNKGGVIKQTKATGEVPETNFKDEVNNIRDVVEIDDDELATEAGKVVDVKITLEVQPEKDTAEGATQIKQEAETKKLQVGPYIDIQLKKTSIVNGEPQEPDNAQVKPGKKVTIEITVPEALRKAAEGMKRTFSILRAHNGEPAEELPDKDVSYDEKTGILTVKSDKFSTYAIAYKDEATTTPTTPSTPSPGGSGGGGGGGGGSSSMNYRVAAASKTIANGSVSFDASQARKGKKVTVTLNPDEGYELDKLTILDKNGKAIAYEKVDDTHYTFVMPGTNVSVGATFQPIAPTPSTPSSFNDVLDNSWYANSVQYVVAHGMMNGTGNGQFSPDGDTTRAMIVTILHRLEETPTGDTSAFTDVEADKWYTDAVAWAAAHEIVNGYGNNLFRPNTSISREQMAAILWRYAKYKEYDVSVGEDTTILSFNDSSTVSEYAVPALQWACGAGIINGKNGNILDPKGTTTRAQVAAMLERFMTKVVPPEEETDADKSDEESDDKADSKSDSKSDDKSSK